MISRCETGQDGKYSLYYIMIETRNYWYSHLTSFRCRGCRQHVHHLRLGKPKSSICLYLFLGAVGTQLCSPTALPLFILLLQASGDVYENVLFDVLHSSQTAN